MQEKTSGTGSLADFGVHMLDLTDYLLHDKIGDYVSFNAMTSTLVKERYVIDGTDVMGGKKGDEKAPVTNDDVSVFSAVSESGALVTFQTGRLVNCLSMFEIAGTNGVVTRSSAYPKGKLGFYDRTAGKPMLEQIDIDADIMEEAEKHKGIGHGGVLGEFIRCIKTGEQPVRDFTHGVYIQRLIDNFSKSAKTGETIHEKVSETDIG
jgi:predicted dehydrogenase